MLKRRDHTRATALGLGVLMGVALLLTPRPASAAMSFDRLTDDMFIVSHRVKLWGSRSKAMAMVYDKAASLCVAAGYTHLEIRDQESEAWQEEEAANASVRVRFFIEEGEERIDCAGRASAGYIDQATIKLRRRGY